MTITSLIEFGLKNAPVTFQKLMDKTTNWNARKGNSHLFRYRFTSSLREHEIKFKNLINKLHEANCNRKKYEFLRKEVIYLGHVINGVHPDPKKIEAIKNFLVPKN